MSKNRKLPGSRITVEPQLLFASNGAERARVIDGRKYVSSEDVIRGLGRCVRVVHDGTIVEQTSIEPKFDRLFGNDTHASMAKKTNRAVERLAGDYGVADHDISSVFATKREILATYDVINGGGLYTPGQALLVTEAAALLREYGQDCAAFIRTDVDGSHDLNTITIETAGSASGRVWSLFDAAIKAGESVANTHHYQTGNLPAAYHAADVAMRQVIGAAFTSVA